MASAVIPTKLAGPLPDHLQLPDKDNVPVQSSLEPWQSSLLSETLVPVLRQRNPDGDYFIGQDCGIYWERTDPPALGCRSPDWYLVLDVPHVLDGVMRRSYVLWQEMVPPFMLLEYASDGGNEERDATPKRGKFWVYERRLRPPYYGIFLPDAGTIEMYHLVEDRFVRMPANAQGRYPIASLGVELGIWHGKHGEYDFGWMRWWDARGNLLLTGQEHAALSDQRAAKSEERAAKLAEKLKSMGVDPDQV